MRALRPPLVVGLALVVMGGLWLLRNLGILTGVPVAPVVLIAVGALVLAAGLRGEPDDGRWTTTEGTGRTGGPAREPVRVPLDGATRVRLLVDHGAGTLRLGAGASVGQLVEGRLDGGVAPEVQRVGDVLEVRLRPSTDPGGWFARGDGLSWDLALSAEVPIELEVRTGASKVRADLTGLAVEQMRLRTGASDVDLVLPDRGTCRASISAGAADVRVHVPDAVAATVRNRTALAGFSIDEHRFPRSADGYRSVGYDDAAARVELDVEGGVASFSVR